MTPKGTDGCKNMSFEPLSIKITLKLSTVAVVPAKK